MSLGVVILGIIALSVLLYLMHFAWRDFFSSFVSVRLKHQALPCSIAVVLVLAVALTYAVGALHPSAFQWSARQTTAAPEASQAAHPGDGATLENRLASLNARLAQDADDLHGWVLLARTHATLSHYTESAAALKKALQLAPTHPDILADLADMTAMVQGRKLAGEPETYIAAALQSDPRHEKALALAASAAEQAGNQNKAQVYWQLLSQVQQASLKNSAPQATVTTVQVSLSQSTLNQTNANSALFVVMKTHPGPGQPLAVVRIPIDQLRPTQQQVSFVPDNFIQKDALNNLPETLYFQARLSIQGTAPLSAGDIESSWQALPRGQLAQGLSIDLK